MTHMKTMIELPDDLFAQAKATAARRRTTLKAMIEHALRREVGCEQRSAEATCFAIDGHGLPVFGKRDGREVTSEMIYDLMDELGV